MIAKDTTTIVRFYATTTDGFPATGQASNISASISLDGDTAIAITATITESDSTNLPGWYEFEYTFDTAGNAFITFTAANCIIMPWEEQVVEIGSSSVPSASDIATAVWSDTATYSGGYGRQPKGYYQVNPPISNPWTIVAIPANNTTYGDLVKSTANNATAIISDMGSLATASNVSTAQSAIIAALPTIPNDYAKTTDIPDISGLATSANVTAAQGAIINAMPSIPTDYAKASDIPDISGLSTFDPTIDRVLIDATQAATMVTATGFATPSDIPTTMINAIKTKVDTLHNTDIEGLATSAEVSDAQDNIILALPSDYAKATDIPDLTGIATSTDVTNAKTAIINAMPLIPTDYAKSSELPDVSGLATSTNVSNAQSAIIAAIPSIPTDYAKSTDIPDISDLATATDVTTAQAAIIDHGDANWTGGGSGGGATPQQIWEYENRTLTASPTDVSALATASDLANSTSTLQTLLTNILAGLYHWRVTNNVLTIYNDSHDAIATFSITRDPTGNIIAVTPINN